jgi:effector-binding domain-containing protein
VAELPVEYRFVPAFRAYAVADRVEQPLDGVELVDLPAGYFAVTLHNGPFTDFDRTYGALGSHVAEYCEVAAGPIRELYVVGPGDVADPDQFRTEICWPIQQIPCLTKG